LKTKAILMTDHSLDTGFGIQAHNIAKAMVNADFDVSLLGWGFKHYCPLKRENYTLLPEGNKPYGEDALPGYLHQIKPEILFTQADTRMIMYLPNLLKQIPSKPTWVFYVVIDGALWNPKGKNTKWPSSWTQIIAQADKVVAMSDYGKSILKANGIEATRIYHGLDTSLFSPISEEQKRGLKKQANIPEDLFIFGGVFKNIQRKNPEKYLHAFKLFKDALPDSKKDKVALLLHTPQSPMVGGQFFLPQQAQDLGLVNGKDVLYGPIGIPRHIMPNIYRSMDVFMHLGTMESFGIPLIEALSVGLSIIGIDSCTMPELIGKAGLISKVPKYNKNNKITYGSYMGVECDLVDPYDVAKKMRILYDDESLRKELGLIATERAIKTFDWSIIGKQWVDFMKSLVITEDQIPDEWAKLYAEVGQ